MKNYWICLFLATLAGIGEALSGEINLIYPRSIIPEDTFIYNDDFDSTFVLGNVVPPEGLLTINGYHVAIDEFGAFLAFLPLRKGDETKSWNLNLIQQGDSVTLSFPYQVADNIVKEIPDSFDVRLPAIVEVSVPNSHIRTMPGGSYYLFPAVGTKFQAIKSDGKFVTIDLGASTFAIEKRFVELSQDSAIDQAIIGDAECESREDWTVCSFELNTPVAWRAELTADQKTLEVLLYDAVSSIDRIRYDINDKFLEDITWQQEPDGLLLSIHLNAPEKRGFHIEFADSLLEISIRQPYAANEKRLKNRTIVVDAGHGGDADGAIGPLGNHEKDITLRWAKLLAEALEHQGAVVVQTREFDETKSLYERTEMARGVNADFFVSLHGNALPDGTDPSTRSGTGTYYYQSLSRDAAEKIHWHLLKAGGLNDDGLWDANFAVARPTEFPAVLIEAAYLIQPQEERLFIEDDFLQKLSNAVVRGLEDYFRED